MEELTPRVRVFLPHRLINKAKSSGAAMRKMEQRSSKTAAITPEKSKDDLCRRSRWGVRGEKKKKKLQMGLFSGALRLKRDHKDPCSSTKTTG